MSNNIGADDGAPPKRYNRHPLFDEVPLDEAIRRGLAVEVKPGGVNDPLTGGINSLARVRPLSMNKSDQDLPGALLRQLARDNLNGTMIGGTKAARRSISMKCLKDDSNNWPLRHIDAEESPSKEQERYTGPMAVKSGVSVHISCRLSRHHRIS
ncbi:hypothetical protein GGR50DRAFT_113893 [Xylaria sp. CBS 124048]|nr:hypothetical protein GGR50DRAFT_113893 [Xylaria sp. CBS 124048]